ncbi:MAG: LCP family protein [Clostridia bacterium]|nr:LCP family protein [Clostridia bacterium]
MAEDIYFNKNKNKKTKSSHNAGFTEKINPEQLSSEPGEYSFGNIRKDNKVIKGSAPVKTKKQADKEKAKAKASNTKNKLILRSVICCFLTLIIVLGIGISAAAAYILKDYSVQEFGENIYTESSSLLHSDRVYNILLMGIDTLDTEASSRSDAMILLSVDTKHNQLKLTSFLRDSYVYIPGSGYAKLNASCVYGGPQLVCDTIEYNFGVRIDDYAKVGYDMFIKIIDAVGGVTIPEIDETEVSALKREGIFIEPGENIDVNGTEALAYCRIRKGQDDFYRTGRQREVLSLVLKKLIRANPVTLINTAKDIAGTIECSIDKSEFVSLALKMASCIMKDIEQQTIPADGTWYNDTKNYQSVLVLDFDENKEKLNEFLYK